MARSDASRDIQYEVGGSLAPPLAKAHGVTRAEVGAELRRVQGLLAQLLGDDAPSGFVRAVRRPAIVRGVTSSAARWRRRRVSDVVHIGIGGSSLGAESLFRAMAHPHHNLLDARRRRAPRVHFVDNVDPESLGALFEIVDLGRALVHVVSKSGGTVETAAGFQIVRDAMERARPAVPWQKRCVFTTGRSALRAVARQEGVEVLDFPEAVGGRFSVLTPSGLFTPAVAGVDVASVVAGARRLLARVAAAPVTANPAAVAAAVGFILAERRRKPIHAVMPYADCLEPFGRWTVQLLGESLGKVRRRGGRIQNVGPTPLPAKGTTDQHSQVQLFVEGPRDKWVTFVTSETLRRRLPIGGGAPADYLEGVELGDLLRAEQKGTEVALARAGRPTAKWILPAITPDALGQLFFAFELQTAFQGALYGIDAYDQPGVEAGKLAAFALIGRAGYEADREQIEANAPPSWRL